MDLINKVRMAAGISVKSATKNVPQSIITEARSIPRSKEKLEPLTKESHQDRINSVRQAIELLRSSIKVLEKIPAVDFNGDIPHYIREIEKLVNDKGESGLEHYLNDLHQYHEWKFTKQDLGKLPPEKNYPEIRTHHAYDAEQEEQELPEPPAHMGNLPHPPAHMGKLPEPPAHMGKLPEPPEMEQEEYDEEYEDIDLGPEGATQPQSRQQQYDNNYMGEAKKPCVDCDELIDKKKKKKVLKEDAGDYSNETYPLSWGYNSGPVNVIDTKKQGTLFNPPKQEEDESNYEKITVPASIKKSLKDAIKQAEKDMSGFASTDRANIGFYEDVIKYFNTILDCLNNPEPCSIKHAQTYYTSVMSPIQYKLPDDVTLFLAGAGQKRTLKDLFHQVKLD